MSSGGVRAGVSGRGALLFLAMCLLWGIPYLLIRVAVRDFSPASVVFLRTGIGAALLLPLVLRRRQFAGLARHWRPLLAYTVLEVTVPWWLLTDAERHLTSSLSGLIVVATPLIGVVVNRLTGGEEILNGQRIAGLVLGIGGVIALLGLQLGSVDGVAVLQVLLVAVGYAIGPIVLARRLSELPGAAVVTASLGITALVYAVPAALTWPRHVTAHAAEAVVGLAIFCTAIAFVVFFALIREVGPTRATVITFVNPAVAIALGVGILGEPFTTGMAVGFPVVLLGSVLATRQPARLGSGADVAEPGGDLVGKVPDVRRDRLPDLDQVGPHHAEPAPWPDRSVGLPDEQW